MKRLNSHLKWLLILISVVLKIKKWKTIRIGSIDISF